ncbi:peptidoglycan-binding protein [Kitasatospora sp. NPDC096204]|uniref:peptidoglycan-binding domain-containing protein n=1 Tax=Kitasatospora sp. NPDC096204 TaxID=3364094 RepID=UPI00381BA63C
MKLRMKSALRRGTVAACGALLLTTVCTTSASAQPGLRYIRYGDRGAPVTCVQIAVNKYYGYKHLVALEVDVDGIFGDDTLRAVKDFQRSLGYDQDGVVGPLTGTELYADYLGQSDPFCWSVMPTSY